MIHYNIWVKGKVQGVFFRDSTQKTAEKMGVFGWVRNEPDGSVYIEAEAPEEKMKAFLEWCRQGPRMARVQSVDYDNGPLQGFDTFFIQR